MNFAFVHEFYVLAGGGVNGFGDGDCLGRRGGLGSKFGKHTKIIKKTLFFPKKNT